MALSNKQKVILGILELSTVGACITVQSPRSNAMLMPFKPWATGRSPMGVSRDHLNNLMCDWFDYDTYMLTDDLKALKNQNLIYYNSLTRRWLASANNSKSFLNL